MWELVDALCPDELHNTELSTQTAWGLRLAGEILSDNLKRNDLRSKRRKLLQRVQKSQPCLLRSGILAAAERAAAGIHLARIGDPRDEVMKVDAMEFCRVPPGAFFLGSPAEDEDAYDDQKQGAGDCNVDYGYWIGRFPVTVAQFSRFVEEADFAPGDPDCLRGPDNTPVVYVSWHEALELCDWLTGCWRQKGWLPEGWRVDLPSEPEWEKAAKGGQRRPMHPKTRGRQAGTG